MALGQHGMALGQHGVALGQHGVALGHCGHGTLIMPTTRSRTLGGSRSRLVPESTTPGCNVQLTTYNTAVGAGARESTVNVAATPKPQSRNKRACFCLVRAHVYTRIGVRACVRACTCIVMLSCVSARVHARVRARA